MTDLKDFCANTTVLVSTDNINFCDHTEADWMRFAGEFYQHAYTNDTFMFLGKFVNSCLIFWNLNQNTIVEIPLSGFYRLLRISKEP